jgi:3-dehydroquinate dehydratase-1
LTLTFQPLWNNTFQVKTDSDVKPRSRKISKLQGYSCGFAHKVNYMSAVIPSGQICLSIHGKTVAEVLRVAQAHGHDADLIEIRLDLLAAPEVVPFTEGLTMPLLFTNRPTWEGGAWQGLEGDRVALLLEAVRAGASYVDIELRAPGESLFQIMEATGSCDCATIVSWHDFAETPETDQLLGILAEMADSGADIGKIVTTAHDYADTLRVLGLQLAAKDLGFPLACFSMGKAGQISRAATLSLGGVLTYGAADRGACTAPGQLGVAELRALQEMLR